MHPEARVAALNQRRNNAVGGRVWSTDQIRHFYSDRLMTCSCPRIGDGAVQLGVKHLIPLRHAPPLPFDGCLAYSHIWGSERLLCGDDAHRLCGRLEDDNALWLCEWPAEANVPNQAVDGGGGANVSMPYKNTIPLNDLTHAASCHWFL